MKKKILKSRILLSKIAEIFSTALMAIVIAKVQDNLSFYTMYLGYITLAMRPCPIFFHAWMRQSRLEELLYFCTVCAKKCEKKRFCTSPKVASKTLYKRRHKSFSFILLENVYHFSTREVKKVLDRSAKMQMQICWTILL